MNRRNSFSCIACLLPLLLFPTCLSASNSRPLGIYVERFTVQRVSIIEALRLLRTIVGKNELLFGLEVAPYETEAERNLTISVNQGTVGEILDQIASQDPRYEYEVVDEHLIHIFPRTAKDDPSNLLNIEVEHFRVSGVGYERKVLSVLGIQEVEVEVVLDPPWDASKMSEAAKLQLGLL